MFKNVTQFILGRHRWDMEMCFDQNSLCCSFVTDQMEFLIETRYQCLECGNLYFEFVYPTPICKTRKTFSTLFPTKKNRNFTTVISASLRLFHDGQSKNWFETKKRPSEFCCIRTHKSRHSDEKVHISSISSCNDVLHAKIKALKLNKLLDLASDVRSRMSE